MARRENQDMREKQSRFRKLQLVTALGVLVLLTVACSSVNVSIPPTNTANIQAAMDTPSPKNTEVTPTVVKNSPTTTPTEVLATPTEEFNDNSQDLEIEINSFLQAEGKYSQESLPKMLYRIDGQIGPSNQLGIILKESHALEQAVLLGGMVKNDFLFVFLGTQDRVKNRVVHISAWPISAFNYDLKFAVLLRASPGFNGQSYREGSVFIDSTDAVKNFLNDFTGEGVVSAIMLQASFEVTNLPKEHQEFARLAEGTYGMGNCLVNEIFFVTADFSAEKNQVPACQPGMVSGIYSSANPLSAEIIRNLEFDPNTMTIIGGSFWVKEIPNLDNYTRAVP